MKKSIFTILALVLAISSFAQKQNYTIHLFGKEVGKMTIERKIGTDGLIFYKMESHSEAKVMFTTKINDVTVDCTYKNGKLFSSYAKNTVNGEVDNYASVSLSGSQYNIQNERRKYTSPEAITFSVVSLYYAEPSNMTKIFSERAGEWLDMVRTSDGGYEFKMPNGDKNIYKYKNGKVSEVELRRTFGTVYMRPAV
jgi:hypothetical protein